jgi:hypothetical protein
LYNVGGVREITCIGTALTKVKESGSSTTFRRLKQWKTWEEACQGFILDNKQVYYQSPMIEVEGKIDNQPIAILIDFGASHSYMNSNIVKRFHLQWSKHKKSWLV